MQEFREAHQKMFGSKNNNSKETNSKPIVSVASSTNVSSNVSTMSSTNVSTVCSANQANLEKSSLDSQTNESIAAEIACSTTQSANATNQSHMITPPPPMPTATLAIGSKTNGLTNDGKFRKLNTFGKLVQPDQRTQRSSLPNNVLPKNNLNGLNETVKVVVLRTSSPNKKGPAPQPPTTTDGQTNGLVENGKNNCSKLSKIIKATKKDAFNAVNNNNLYLKKQQQMKLEGQTNGSPVESTGNKYSSVEKSNYLTKTATDLSLSSLSIKVQVPTK